MNLRLDILTHSNSYLRNAARKVGQSYNNFNQRKKKAQWQLCKRQYVHILVWSGLDH